MEDAVKKRKSGESEPVIVKHDTGSEFTGHIVHGWMEGKGEYLFQSGTKYVGDFKNGTFHGHGVLYFPNGGKFEAEWENGTTMGGRGAGGKYTFKDGLVHVEEEWEYCTPVDRRFYSETCKGIKPAGRTQLTDKEPSPEVPLGWYDCGDGLYNPENRVVYTYSNSFLRNADVDEHEWIVRTCRKGVTPAEQL